MNLEEFISTSLTQIAAGVHKAKTEAVKNGLKVGFPLYVIPSSNTVVAGKTAQPHAQEIQFDIAVTASSEAGAKAGITVLGLELGSAGGQLKNSTVSRIQFSLPAIWG